jgi:hypothetical protein
MTIEEIQARLDAMAVAMGDKGVRTPESTMMLDSGDACCPALMLRKADPEYDFNIRSTFMHASGDTLAEKLDSADAFIAAMPTPEENRRNEFMAQLAKVIDLGRENGIDTAYLSPLYATMKRLSKNALTDQRVAPDEAGRA